MNDEILNSIAKDLKIDTIRFGLTSEEYRCSIIYTAAALWSKVSSQDLLENIDRGSRKHVLHVCSNFIDAALVGEPDYVQNYFLNKEHDPEKSPAVKLVDALVRVQELSETGDNPSALTLSLAADRIIQLNKNYQAVLGFLGTESIDHIKDYKIMCGLTCIMSEYSNNFPVLINNDAWVEERLEQIKTLKPSRVQKSNRDLYFDIRDYGDRRFTRHKPHDNYPFEIVMNETIAGEQYYLKTGDGFYIFNDLQVDLKEHHRFIIYLVSKLGGKMLKFSESAGVMHLDLFISLPLYEDNLIRLVLWPKRSIDDSGSFYGPSFLKSYILDILNNLGLEI